MKKQVVRAVGFVAIAAGVLAGCGTGTTMRADGGTRTPPRMTNNTARMTRGTTAPMGATSMGMMSRPMAGTQTVPIMNTEVFSFMCTPDGTTTATTCYWAYDATTMRNYIWWTEMGTCPSTMAPASAAIIVEINADGSGGFIYGSDCADLAAAGCQFDASGTATVCGACTVDATGLVTCSAG